MKRLISKVSFQKVNRFVLTCIGDGEAVGRLYVVHMRDEVKGGFRGVGAGVVEEDGQSERRVLLIGIPNKQPTWRGRRGEGRGGQSVMESRRCEL